MKNNMRYTPRKRKQLNSLSRKYSIGYFQILTFAVFVFVLSFIGSQIIFESYHEAVNELLNINQIFVEIEDVDSEYKYFYLFQGRRHLDILEDKINKVKTTIADIRKKNEIHYARDEIDLCNMVETYLEQIERTSDLTLQYMEKNPTGSSDAYDNEILKGLNQKTQETLIYIRQSFRDTYSVKLADMKTIQERLVILRNMMYLLQLFVVLIALWHCIKFYRQVVEGISISMSRLTEFAKKIQENTSTQEHIQIETGDEIEFFADTLNDMVDTINDQIAKIEDDSKMREQLSKVEMENLRINSALQNSELKFLQTRMNPHFLFNTLNMILKTAEMEQAYTTSGLLSTTAELLRYNLNKLSIPVTLKEEIENINNYITIQVNRFEDLVSFCFEIDETCLSQKMPAMILQPIVENAITHGVGKLVEGGTVTIRIYSEDNRCFLDVEDDGVGINAKRLEEIKEMYQDNEEDSDHIGLKNVYQRLMLFYKGDMSFSLESSAGFTLVHIDMPVLNS